MTTINFYSRPGHIILGRYNYSALCQIIGGTVNAYEFEPTVDRLCYEIPTLMAYQLQARYPVTFKCVGTVNELYD